MRFMSMQGFITSIDDFWTNSDEENLGCYKIISLEDSYGSVVNFVVAPTTYFVDHVMLRVGDLVTGFYDANAPVPLIFPPQFRAIVMTKNSPYQNVKVDFFNSELVSSDNQLKLNTDPQTPTVLENGQSFTNNPANRNLIVIYGATTRSIPAQTTPYKIIVMC
ncbi:hypothetical protein LGK97_13500 [Clostridium sp. CS001]|uniref:hypothetical protein n=1 Tax=Clostridium sp. CS001 TaxID=2880648 RepID=UPI001CF1EC94|nr:hypothetical protein [Clostridium sp. CS001]MCB2290756.1 hypothetical protein [Clostridium sp. CS001]